MQTGVWISLIIYFAVTLGIGFYAWRKSTSNSEEYMLGGRNLPPAVAALSAGATLADPENIFILLAETLFPALITGFLFAALLAAIMSTVSSQLLVSSSSLAEDFYKLFVNKQASDRAIVTVGRIAVVSIGCGSCSA